MFVRLVRTWLVVAILAGYLVLLVGHGMWWGTPTTVIGCVVLSGFLMLWVGASWREGRAERALPPGVPFGTAPVGQPEPGGRPVAWLAGHVGAVRAVGFSPDGRLLATGDDAAVRLWDLTDPVAPAATVVVPRPAATRALAFSPDGQRLATGTGDGSVVLWDVQDPTRVALGAALARRQGRPRAVEAVAFSPHGRLLAAGTGDGTVVLWDLTGPTPRTTATISNGRRRGRRTYSVGFSPHGNMLAAGGKYDGPHSVVLWDVTDPARPVQAAQLEPHPGGHLLTASYATTYAAVFHPAGRLLATAGDNHLAVTTGDITTDRYDSAVVLWDLTHPTTPARRSMLAQRGGQRPTLSRRQQRRHGTVTTLTGHRNTPRTVAFNTTGRLLATGGDDHTALIWNISDPAQPTHAATLPLPAKVRAVAFSPHQRLLATTGDNATAALWAVDQDSPGHDTARPATATR